MKEKIIEILTDIRPEFDFGNSTDFISEGLLDSFDIIQLVTALDDEFSVSIDGGDILPENFATIDSITLLLIKNGIAI